MTQKINYHPLKQTLKFTLNRHKPQTSGLKMPKNYEAKALKLTTLALTTFLVTLLTASILTPVQPSGATEVLSALQTTNGTVSLTTSASTIDLSLTAGSAGAVRTAMDTVTVTSSATGYQLYLSTASSTNALIRDGATSTGTDSTTGLPTYAINDTIPATSTTSLSTPTVLPNDTWGFAVANTNTTSGSGSEDVIETANFGEASTFPTGDNSVTTSKFAAVPTAGDEVLIAKRTSTASAVPTNIYYGIRATSAKPAGLYKNTVVYTAIGDGSINNLASVSPNRTNKIQGGETLTIATPSTLSLSSIASISVTIGGKDCTNPTAEKASDDISINLTCISLALATGWHEVIATITTTADSTDTYIVNPGIEYYSEVPTTYTLSINFAGSGVSSVQVRTASGTSGTLIGTISTSGNGISNLNFNTDYYLYPTFNDGYTINSWSKTSSAGTLTSATKFNPTFTTSSGDITITITGMPTPTTMQDITLAYCDSLSTNTTLTLTDSRDSNTYTMAKLGDGNCWQTQNMRLGATPGALTTAKAFTLTSANSDVTSDFSVATSNIANSGTTSWSNPVDAKHIYLTGNATYGNYYNWFTATSGTGTASMSSGDATSSICPASGTPGTPWKLPPSTGNGSYTTMFQSSGVVANGTITSTNTTVTNKMKAAPYSFPFSGRYLINGVNEQNSYGSFWSRTVNSIDHAYYFYYGNSGYFSLQNSNNKYSGYSIRCVLITPE